MSPDETVTNEVVAAIRSGKVDLAQVNVAVRSVIEKGAATLQWVFHPQQIPALLNDGKLGSSVCASDLTIGEQVYIMDETGMDWSHLDPRADQKVGLVFLTALIAHRNPELGRDYDKARAIAERVTTGEFDDAYTLEEQRPPDPT